MRPLPAALHLPIQTIRVFMSKTCSSIDIMCPRKFLHLAKQMCCVRARHLSGGCPQGPNVLKTSVIVQSATRRESLRGQRESALRSFVLGSSNFRTSGGIRDMLVHCARMPGFMMPAHSLCVETAAGGAPASTFFVINQDLQLVCFHPAMAACRLAADSRADNPGRRTLPSRGRVRSPSFA